jgi:hypothetical protein
MHIRRDGGPSVVLPFTVPWLRVISNRLTYANVVATLALFIALGGASYASLVLPAGSVGRAQLRAGSVTPPALGFPLGAQAFNDTSPVALVRGGCNGGEPVPPGQPRPPCKPSRLTGSTLGDVTLRRPGELLVSGVVDVRNEATPGTSATVRLGVLIEPNSERQRILDPSSVVLDGGQGEQVPMQGLVTLSSGRHAVGLGEDVEYHGGSAGSGEVILPEASIIVTELPATPR